MCGRYLLDIDIENLESIYDIVNKGEIDAQWQLTNATSSPTIFPTNRVPVVYTERLGLMQWGYHLPSVKGAIINCRIESLMDKPFFQEALAKRRIVIPASAYYEWRTLNGPKEPYTVFSKSHATLHIAGVFFKNPESNMWGFAVVTTPASGAIKEIHHRMPLLLSLDQLSKWRTVSNQLKPRDIVLWADQSKTSSEIEVNQGLLQKI